MNAKEHLTNIMSRLADLNTLQFRKDGALPPLLVLAPKHPRPDGTRFEVLPLEAVDSPTIRDAIADAFLTITCLEGHMMEQRRDNNGRFPNVAPDTVADNPDARRCLVYLAQAFDGTRACAVQYILKPEHGRATLTPLKVLNDCNVAIADSDLADLTRPGRTPRGTAH